MSELVLSALGNQTRLKLITCLSHGSKNVNQLINNCGLSQSAVSQHLSKLRLSGLVKTEKRGKEVYYSLAYPKVAKVSETLQQFIEEVI